MNVRSARSSRRSAALSFTSRTSMSCAFFAADWRARMRWRPSADCIERSVDRSCWSAAHELGALDAREELALLHGVARLDLQGDDPRRRARRASGGGPRRSCPARRRPARDRRARRCRAAARRGKPCARTSPSGGGRAPRGARGRARRRRRRARGADRAEPLGRSTTLSMEEVPGIIAPDVARREPPHAATADKEATSESTTSRARGPARQVSGPRAGHLSGRCQTTASPAPQCSPAPSAVKRRGRRRSPCPRASPRGTRSEASRRSCCRTSGCC